MYSGAYHTARSSARRMLETCRGSTVLMLLVYSRKSVGEISTPCGTPRIFTLLLKCPSSFTLANLSCKKHRSVSTFFQKRRSQVSSAGDLLARCFQKRLSGRRNRNNLFLFLKGILCLLDNEGQLIFRASVVPISSLCWWQYFLFF